MAMLERVRWEACLILRHDLWPRTAHLQSRHVNL
jgi:hypothetical protein